MSSPELAATNHTNSERPSTDFSGALENIGNNTLLSPRRVVGAMPHWFAPDTPSLDMLNNSHILVAGERIRQMRERVSNVLGGMSTELLVVTGPCGLTDEQAIYRRENEELTRLNSTDSGLVFLERANVWKPRSDKGFDRTADSLPGVTDIDWHGLETTDPIGAFHQINDLANYGANVTLEAGHRNHVTRYGSRASMMWVGARTHDRQPYTESDTLFRSLALTDPALPIAIKSGMSGTSYSVNQAISAAKLINHLRHDAPDAAPAAVIYRAGNKITTPEQWEEGVRMARELTRVARLGLIVDVAHGGEMAHHPSGEYKKSVPGQIAALDHFVAMQQDGLGANGVMMEATDARSFTDPVMPFSQALRRTKALAHPSSEA